MERHDEGDPSAAARTLSGQPDAYHLQFDHRDFRQRCIWSACVDVPSRCAFLIEADRHERAQQQEEREAGIRENVSLVAFPSSGTDRAGRASGPA